MQEPKELTIETLTVVKRDGRNVKFDATKIERAIVRAAKSVDTELTEADHQDIEDVMVAVLDEISSRFKDDVKIYEIQSIVEHELMERQQLEWAQATLITGPKRI